MHNSQSNNFDFLRFLAAFSVFVAHSFSLMGDQTVIATYGPSALSFGTLGVSIFFAISGYLVTQSWVRTAHPLRFAKKRALRIYPAIVLNCLLVLFLIAPLTTTLPLADYNLSVLSHLPLHLFHYLIFSPAPLPGTFSDNPFAGFVNESLWTLPYEIACYVAIALLGIGCGVRIGLPALTIVYTLFFWPQLSAPANINDWAYIYCAIFLLSGCFYLLGERIQYRFSVALACVAIPIIASIFNIEFIPALILAITYLTLTCALASSRFAHFAKYGDFSYGMYIYAFPIQQTFITIGAFHRDDPSFYAFMLLSFLATLAFSALSWHAVERPALRLSHRK